MEDEHDDMPQYAFLAIVTLALLYAILSGARPMTQPGYTLPPLAAPQPAYTHTEDNDTSICIGFCPNR